MIEKVKDKISQLIQKQFFKDSFWMTFFNIVSAAIGFFYFILLARYLGAEGYGAFAGVKAIWAIIFPFIGFGMGDILVQKVSRDSSKFPRCWGDALVALAASALLAMITVLPIVVLILSQISVEFILLIFLGDIIGQRLCHLCTSAFIANHQIKRASQLSILYALSKLLAVIALPLFADESRLIAWGLLYFLGSLIPALILLVIVSKNMGLPSIKLRDFELSNIKEGFFFSLSASAVTVNSEVDRSMLVAMDTPLSAGIYGAGYRFIDIGFLPVMSILSANYARFFKHGEKGILGTLDFARKLLPAAILYGIASAIFLLIFAPFAPRLLGGEYAEAQNVLVFLSPVILLGSIQFLAADSLTGAGFQRSRSFIQVAAAVLNVTLNLILIPMYSWRGAIIATLCSETFKVITLGVVIFSLYIKEKKLANYR